MSVAYEHLVKSSEAVAVLSKATLRAAKRLGVQQVELADIIGVSPAVVSRAAKGSVLPQIGKALELSLLFVRVFRSLDAIVGGDEKVAAIWLRSYNEALGAKPIDIMRTVAGLTATLAYLDARRSLV